jgi:predicted dehydrogenase
MKRYRVAIVGLGRMASTIDDEVADHPAVGLPYSIAAACRASERLEILAGADVDPAKREAFRARWGVTALYDDYREMLERERPEMVAICTRGPLHAEMAVATAQAGVPMLYLEKALGCSMREADAVLASCLAHGTRLNLGTLRRFDPRYRQARRWIEKGEIGRLRGAAHFAATDLLHGHSHSVDTLLYLLGECDGAPPPRAVAVQGELRPSTLEIVGNRIEKDPGASYRIRFEDGLEGWSLPVGSWDFQVWGSEGEIRITNNGLDMELRKATKLNGKHTVLRPVPVDVPTGSMTLACLEDLVDAHEQGRPPLGNVEISHHGTEICFAVAESHASGGAWVDLPLANRDLYIHHV